MLAKLIHIGGFSRPFDSIFTKMEKDLNKKKLKEKKDKNKK